MGWIKVDVLCILNYLQYLPPKVDFLPILSLRELSDTESLSTVILSEFVTATFNLQAVDKRQRETKRGHCLSVALPVTDLPFLTLLLSAFGLCTELGEMVDPRLRELTAQGQKGSNRARRRDSQNLGTTL